MKRNLMVGICMLLGMAWAAEARDWGFSKDTVYEWKAGGDTVFLVNTGSDTLTLSFARAIDIDSAFWIETILYYHPLVGDPLPLYFAQQSAQYRVIEIPEGANILPPHESAVFRNFEIGAPPIASKAGMAFSSDTIKMGILLRAQNGEEDTLIVVGKFAGGSSLMPRSPRKRHGSPVLLEHDLKGRRVVPSRNFPALGR